MIYGLGLLDLRDQRRAASGFLNQTLRFDAIFRTANEREGDVIGFLLDSPLQIGPIFLGQRSDRQQDARQVDTLALAQNSTVDHAADQIGLRGRLDVKRDGTVIQK